MTQKLDTITHGLAGLGVGGIADKRGVPGAACVEAHDTAPISQPAIGSFIRQLRLSRDLTLSELADRVGCVKGYLSAIERGKRPPPRREIAWRLEEMLGIPRGTISRAGALARTPSEVLCELANGPGTVTVMLLNAPGEPMPPMLLAGAGEHSGASRVVVDSRILCGGERGGLQGEGGNGLIAAWVGESVLVLGCPLSRKEVHELITCGEPSDFEAVIWPTDARSNGEGAPAPVWGYVTRHQPVTAPPRGGRKGLHAHGGGRGGSEGRTGSVLMRPCGQGPGFGAKQPDFVLSVHLIGQIRPVLAQIRRARKA